MKILVTGHIGCLGSVFVEQYKDEYEIVGYDLVDGDDLLNYDNLLSRMGGCEMVVHLAAIPKPVMGKTFDDYITSNVLATRNVLRAACTVGARRVVYASSTTIYGIEGGIPFKTPITESQPFVSQYLSADQLSCRDVDLSYHMSKVMAEQVLAWYGLNKKIQTAALRFGPINKVFLGASVSINNATHAINCALTCKENLWYEAFSIVDEVEHIDISKAKRMLGYTPEPIAYTPEQIHSTLDARTM